MGVKILTVDDSRMVRVIVSKTFAPLGCEILEASTGAEALLVAQDFTPDIIFMDVTMGDMSGLAVVEQLRAMPQFASTPVIMLTAESGQATLERAELLKVAGYVAKPFKGEQLLALVAPYLSPQPPAASP